jgi:hypothetical protein
MLWVRISMRAKCTTLCNKVCQWLATGWWFSPGSPVSSINKTDGQDITEILLKMALKPSNKQTNKQTLVILKHCSNRKIIPLRDHRIKRNQAWQENRYIVYYLNFLLQSFYPYLYSVRNSRWPTNLDSVEICFFIKSPLYVHLIQTVHDLIYNWVIFWKYFPYYE